MASGGGGGGGGGLEVAMENICVFSRSMPHMSRSCGALRIVNGGSKHEKINPRNLILVLQKKRPSCDTCDKR